MFLYPNDSYCRICLSILFSSSYVYVLSFSIQMITYLSSIFFISLFYHFLLPKLTTSKISFLPHEAYSTLLSAQSMLHYHADRHCLTKFLCVFLCIILNGSSNSTIHLITSFYSVVEVSFPYLRYCPFQDFKRIQLFTLSLFRMSFYLTGLGPHV